MINEDATPTLISKNLAELKANKVSNKNPDKIVLGADSVIDLEGELLGFQRRGRLNDGEDLVRLLNRVGWRGDRCSARQQTANEHGPVLKMESHLLVGLGL